MHLREVTLRNWRSYRSAVFRFPSPRGKQKVLLVGAMNGQGKTSLLMALYLGLFGREAMPFLEGVKVGGSEDERVRSYRQLMQRVLHRSALEHDNPHASVKLVFGTGDGTPEDDDSEYVVVTRTWYYTRGGNPRDFDTPEGEDVRVEDNGRVRKTATWQDANNRLAELLFPPHIMPCFFFDGEQAQARVEASGGRALSDAINALFGTGLVSDLDDSLRIYVQQHRAQMRRDGGDVRHEELDGKREQADALDGSLRALERELSEVREALEDAEAARQAKIAEFGQLTGEAAIDSQQLTQRQQDLRNEERDLQERLCKGLAALALPMVLRHAGERVHAQLEAEIVRDRWSLVRDEAASKAEAIVERALPSPDESWLSPALTGQQFSELRRRFHSALVDTWGTEPGAARDLRYPFLSSTERVAVLQRLGHMMASSREDVSSLAAQWHQVKGRLRELQRQLDAVPDVGPRLEELTGRLRALDVQIKELNTRKIGLETEARGLQAQLGDLRASIGKMEGIQRKVGPVVDRVELAERMRNVIRETRDQLVPLCKSSLEESCTKHLREMISGEYRRFRVEFDTDLQPALVGANGHRVYIMTLSGAQKRAFGLAFTLAVAEISGMEAPLVIDTPVGNMDSEYRRRILTYLAKSAPGQVIFLSHDEEIYGDYVRALQPYMRQKYLVKFEPAGDGIGYSTVAEDQYFTP